MPLALTGVDRDVQPLVRVVLDLLDLAAAHVDAQALALGNLHGRVAGAGLARFLERQSGEVLELGFGVCELTHVEPLFVSRREISAREPRQTGLRTENPGCGR